MNSKQRKLPQRPTIVDIARRAGVSRSTVSLVLQESSLVKEQTRAKVLTASKELGYVYNRAAANLRGAGTRLIGLVINDLRNPFFTEFAASAQESLSQAGFATVIANTDENLQTQTQVIASMREHGVDGILLCPCIGTGQAQFDVIGDMRIPTLQVLRRVNHNSDKVPFFTMDYATGGELATRHLLSCGVSKIAFAGGVAGELVCDDRMEGYLRVMKDNRLKPIAFHGRATRKFGRELAALIATRHQDIEAVICFNDLVGLGMIAGFAQHKIAVGPQIKIVGFDDIEECQQVYPQLTSVRYDVKRLGKLTAEKLLGWCRHGKKPALIERLPVKLVVRESSANHHYEM